MSLLALVVCGFVACVLWGCVGDKDEQVVVVGHRWERQMKVEKLLAESASGWCHAKPAGAYDVSNYTKAHTMEVEKRTAKDFKNYTFREFVKFYGPKEKRTAQDGKAYTQEEFGTYYNGTSKGTQEWEKAKRCPMDNAQAVEQVKQIWVDAPHGCMRCGKDTFDDDWCDYKINKWSFQSNKGTKGANAFPYWAQAFSPPCKTVGCQREIKTMQTYTIDLKEILESGKESETYCTAEHGGWDQATWRSMAVGMRLPAKRRMGYGILCGSIPHPAMKAEEKRIANDGKPYNYGDFIEFYFGSDKEWTSAKRAKGQGEL